MTHAFGQPQQPQQSQAPAYPANGGPGNFHPATAPSGAFNGASAMTPMSQPESAQQARQTVRREMTGPSGVDDILRTFEEVRRAENEAASIPQMASGYATQPAVAAAMSSVVSGEDGLSHAESALTGGGRRRRRAQPPVGNTLSLNV